MPNNTIPLLHKTVLKCLSPFKIQMLPHELFLSGFVKTKLNLHVLKVFYEKSALSLFFKEVWVPVLKGLKHPNPALLKTNSFKNSA